jgi:uncharacterized protein (UPF0333 family)
MVKVYILFGILVVICLSIIIYYFTQEKSKTFSTVNKMNCNFCEIKPGSNCLSTMSGSAYGVLQYCLDRDSYNTCIPCLDQPHIKLCPGTQSVDKCV